ncbi:MAG: hydroxyethylthiazole kinase [Kiritimatiellae bacterium]|nr:hydroxyethylthiazole kinase [Kiritimatiellia bacterium]
MSTDLEEDRIEDGDVVLRRKKAPRERKPVTKDAVLKAMSVTLGVLREKQHPRVQLFADAASASLAEAAALALGARPAMAEESAEAAQLADASDGLAVSLASITKMRAEAVRAAVSHCVASAKPWVLSPEIRLPLTMRIFLAKELVRRLPGIVIGSEEEIIALAGGDTPTAKMDGAAQREAADRAAGRIVEEMHAAVMVVASSSARIFAEDRPSLTVKMPQAAAAQLARMPGKDAALAAVAATFLGLLRNHKYAAAACAAVAVAVAGEIASETEVTPMAFQAKFIDALFSLNDGSIAKRVKLAIGD